MDICGRAPATLDEWIKYVGEDFVGKPVPGTLQGNQVATRRALCWFAWVFGDTNPLFLKLDYTAGTRWSRPIAPPTFPISVRPPTTPEVCYPDGIPMTEFDMGLELENFDVIRLEDKIRSEKVITGVEKYNDAKLGPSAIVRASTTIFNQENGVAAQMTGWSIHFPRPPKGKMLYDRGIYKYSPEEKEKIFGGIEKSFGRRGAAALYWEDVKIGDKLPQKVKGPATVEDIYFPSAAIYGPGAGTFRLSYKDTLRKTFGAPSIHAKNSWPMNPMNEHLDWVLCQNRGMPLPFDYGVARAAMSYHLLSDWMGDEGFVRKLRAEMLGPCMYGDTLWMTGQVIKKEKTPEGAAVDIEIKMTNQLGELVTQGSATVLLASRTGGPVILPIPRQAR